jgi:hypothetical protein
MPVDYRLAKIYKIQPLNADHESDVYIGSTCEPSLAHRMAGHRRNYKRWQEGKYNNMSSFKLFEKYGIDNCNIFLIEEFPCDSKDQLRKKEGYYIKNIPCVNKHLPGRSIKESQKEHYKNNKETKKETNKQYYENNKIYFQTKFKCICGSCYTRNHKFNHVKTLKHINYMTKHDDIIKKFNDLIISVKQLNLFVPKII